MKIFSLFFLVSATCLLALTSLADSFTSTSTSIADFELPSVSSDSSTADSFPTAPTEKFEFQAEVNRMMKLLIHSLYKAKDIFLRELISNASDALDKIRFLSLTTPSILGNLPELNITVRVDTDRKLVVITDTGIGMTRAELIKNLGTIAKSGTADFMAALESGSGSENNLIGQFGVGFYSAFLVADKVTVISKNNNDKQYIWESHAESDFTIVEDPRGDTLGRGTQIILHVKEDGQEFLSSGILEEVIRRYSEFINFPIYLLTTRTEQVEVESEEASASEDSPSDSSSGEDALVEDIDTEQEIKKPKTVERTYSEWERMNSFKPIWTRDPKNITDKEYNLFYKSFGKDNNDALAHIHFKAEGDVEFRSILYIPSKAAPNALQSVDAHLRCIKLFVRRVFITDELIDFIPKWLGFLKGLVDSDDLPLNVSRETLQKHNLLNLIRKKVIRKALDLFKQLSEDDVDVYDEFLREYGTHLKLGVIEDTKNRKKILKLLRFRSSLSEKKISLDYYKHRMKKGQEQIYYLTGPTIEDIQKSPFVERITARGYEVLYLDEPIDEYLVQSVYEYDKKSFQNIAKDGLKLGSDEKQKEKLDALTEEYKPLTEYLTTVLLKNNVEKVVVSDRLLTSPCAIVASQFGWSGNQERLMSSQAFGAAEGGYQAMAKKTFEINPKHPVIMELLKKVEKNQLDKSTDELAHVLYEVTAVRSGYMVKNPTDFADRIERVLRISLGVDPDVQAEVEEIEEAPARDEEDEPKKESADEFEVKEEVNEHDEL